MLIKHQAPVILGLFFMGGWVDYYDNYLILNKKISFNNKWVISISH